MRKHLVALGLFLASAGTLRSQDMPLSQIIADGEGWKQIAKDLPDLWRLTPAGQEGLYVSYRKGRARLMPDGTLVPNPGGGSAFSRATPHIRTPDGFVYSAEGDLAVYPPGNAFERHVVRVPGLVQASCLALWRDGGTLVVGDASGGHLWAFRIEKNGELSSGEKYYSLRLRPGEKRSGVRALCLDRAGRVYAATPLGVQVFDPTGRLCGVLANPVRNEPITALCFGGPNWHTLYIAIGDAIYARTMLAQGSAE
jgi:hypothetical protein